MSLVDGDDLVANSVIGGVQADCELSRYIAAAKAADLRNQPNC